MPIIIDKNRCGFLKKVFSDWNSAKTKDVYGVSGSCLMKKFLEPFGFSDKKFLTYFIDVDLCLQAKKAGFEADIRNL